MEVSQHDEMMTQDEDEDDDDTNSCFWCYLPEAALLQIFSYLDNKELLNVGLVCKRWYVSSRDDLLWRDLFHRDFKIDATVYPCKDHRTMAIFTCLKSGNNNVFRLQTKDMARRIQEVVLPHTDSSKRDFDGT